MTRRFWTVSNAPRRSLRETVECPHRVGGGTGLVGTEHGYRSSHRSGGACRCGTGSRRRRLFHPRSSPRLSREVAPSRGPGMARARRSHRSGHIGSRRPGQQRTVPLAAWSPCRNRRRPRGPGPVPAAARADARPFCRSALRSSLMRRNPWVLPVGARGWPRRARGDRAAMPSADGRRRRALARGSFDVEPQRAPANSRLCHQLALLAVCNRRRRSRRSPRGRRRPGRGAAALGVLRPRGRCPPSLDAAAARLRAHTPSPAGTREGCRPAWTHPARPRSVRPPSNRWEPSPLSRGPCRIERARVPCRRVPGPTGPRRRQRRAPRQP